VSWQIVLPGQPPSVNHMYEIVYAGRHPRISKKAEVGTYQAGVTLITRTSRPSGWKYEGGFVRLTYDFHLKRDIDCDNLLKAINDAVAVALETNDRYFLPCVRSKEIGVESPSVTITVDYP
jgi:Holliday junction resolvase RusA-like endonuclease